MKPAAALILSVALTAGGGAQPAASRTLALVGGRLYAGPDVPRPVDDAVVMVEDGRITAAGPRSQVALPAGIKIIDCTNLTIVAGFQNSHVHFTDDRRWADAAARPAAELSAHLQAMLTRHGFTTVVDTASLLDNTLALRRRIDAGEVPGPRILTAGLGLYPADGVPYYVREAVPADVVPLLPQPKTGPAAVGIVRGQIERGADLVKLFTGSWVERGRVKPMDVEVAAAAVGEAHRLGKVAFAHPSNLQGLEVALRAGVDVLAHPIDDTRGLAPEHIGRLVEARVAMVPTLALFDGAPEVLDQVRDFARRGGDVLFGTDIGYLPDFDLADEYRLMASAGLGWRDILASLTVTPARRFGESADRGRVAHGLAADLVVLASDPRADVAAFSRVRYTIKAGRVIYDAGEGRTSVEHDLREMQTRLVRALLEGRREAYAAMLAPEWRVTHLDGTVLTRKQVLDSVFGAAEPPFTGIVQDGVEVQVLGETAIVTGRTTFATRDGGRMALRFTDVVHRRDGAWVVVVSHASPTAR
jgi:imidazolonepropionase-like amidohydrolase